MTFQPGFDVLKVTMAKLGPAKYIFPLLLLIQGVVLLIKKSSIQKENLLISQKLTCKDAFELKAVTFVIGSPEEVAGVMVDAATRCSWDIGLK
mmetsp:Transcript_39406/g.37875  ORF Transcript_39406/g.37875 Transcript_39406/m.37875 type:complete len:93 (-) Transcript_39406:892-1170(-)